MIPVDFEGTNMEMVKPKGWQDEECMSLRAMHGVMENGLQYFIEAWQPNKEDIEAINAGRPVYVQIIHNVLPPIALWTNDENNEPNV